MRTTGLRMAGIFLLGAIASVSRAADAPLSAATTSPPPLVRLGAMLQEALPRLPLASLGLSPAKAQALRDRAMELDGPALVSLADKPQQAPPPAAARLLGAVNSVLRDIPAERLKTMPEDQLHSLAGAIFDQVSQDRASEAPARPNAIEALSQARAAAISAAGKRVKKMTFKDEGSILSRPTKKIYYSGAPRGLRYLPPEPAAPSGGGDESLMRATVFRHYTENNYGSGPSNADLIALGKKLKSSSAPYVREITGWLRRKAQIYTDLTGVFLTLPEVPPAAVGVPERSEYVDLRIPRSLPLLEIEPGRIFFVPLPARGDERDSRHYYRQLEEGKKPRRDGAEEERYYSFLNEEGLPGPDLAIPIEIVGRGKRPE